MMRLVHCSLCEASRQNGTSIRLALQHLVARLEPAQVYGWHFIPTWRMRPVTTRLPVNQLACCVLPSTGLRQRWIQQMKWTPDSRYGGRALIHGDPATKTSQFDEFLAKRDTILPSIAEYSPYALVSSDDPPVYLFLRRYRQHWAKEKIPHTRLTLESSCRNTALRTA